MQKQRVVIVGGGAGGLELACKLGRRMGAEQVTLVDQQLFHVWKPSLHEVAAGTLDIHQEGLSYEMLAHDNGFTFCLGAMTGLDLAGKWLGVAPVVDEQGEELVPARQLPFDQLVFAVGSTANHYNVRGAAEFTLSLNRPADAEHFRLRMLKLLTSADLRKSAGGEGQVRIVIIGGGATGVELAAELREASVVHSRYGFRRIDPHRDVQITLLEGAGVALQSLDGTVSHRLDQPLHPFGFAGERVVQADLLGPDCHDFNVMVRRSACSASVQVLSSAAHLTQQSHGLLFACRGHWHANGHVLSADEGLWWHDEPSAWTLTAQSDDAALIAVLIQPPR